MEDRAAARKRMKWSGVRRVVAAIALVGAWGSAPAWADELQQAHSAAGQVWYQKYCTPCHGAAGAPGTAVSKATSQPVDLRTYVKRNGGKFPTARWIEVIQDVDPGGVHAPVWEDIKRGQEAMPQAEIGARSVVSSIAYYVISVQAK